MSDGKIKAEAAHPEERGERESEHEKPSVAEGTKRKADDIEEGEEVRHRESVSFLKKPRARRDTEHCVGCPWK